MKIRFNYFLIICFGCWSMTACKAQQQTMRNIHKNDMNVKWHYVGERIFFEMSAPTDGWVTIGFNTHSSMTGAYLLMGHIIDGKPNVVEYYTSSPGSYQPIENFRVQPQIENVEGEEKGKQTILRFSLPIIANSKYQKSLTNGLAYVMTLAYSREDDFQHHSMMRTSIEVKL